MACVEAANALALCSHVVVRKISLRFLGALRVDRFEELTH